MGVRPELSGGIFALQGDVGFESDQNRDIFHLFHLQQTLFLIGQGKFVVQAEHCRINQREGECFKLPDGIGQECSVI